MCTSHEDINAGLLTKSFSQQQLGTVTTASREEMSFEMHLEQLGIVHSLEAFQDQGCA